LVQVGRGEQLDGFRAGVREAEADLIGQFAFDGEGPLLGVGVRAVPLGGAAEVRAAAARAESGTEGPGEDEIGNTGAREGVWEGADVGDVDAADCVKDAAEDGGGEDAVAATDDGLIAEGPVGEAEAGGGVVVVGEAEALRLNLNTTLAEVV